MTKRNKIANELSIVSDCQGVNPPAERLSKRLNSFRGSVGMWYGCHGHTLKLLSPYCSCMEENLMSFSFKRKKWSQRSEMSKNRPPVMYFRSESGKPVFGTSLCAPAFSQCRAVRWLIRAGLQQSRDEGTRCHGKCRSENSALRTPLCPYCCWLPVSIRAEKVLGAQLLEHQKCCGVCVRSTWGLLDRWAPGQTNTLNFASIKSLVVIIRKYLIKQEALFSANRLYFLCIERSAFRFCQACIRQPEQPAETCSDSRMSPSQKRYTCSLFPQEADRLVNFRTYSDVCTLKYRLSSFAAAFAAVAAVKWKCTEGYGAGPRQIGC